jgi:hypothetical protein
MCLFPEYSYYELSILIINTKFPAVQARTPSVYTSRYTLITAENKQKCTNGCLFKKPQNASITRTVTENAKENEELAEKD